MRPTGPNGPNWQCCLAGPSKTAPRILIFSIALGADYAFYVKTIETHVRAFLALNILAIGRVSREEEERYDTFYVTFYLHDSN
jgi:hypothetical protein